MDWLILRTNLKGALGFGSKIVILHVRKHRAFWRFRDAADTTKNEEDARVLADMILSSFPNYTVMKLAEILTKRTKFKEFSDEALKKLIQDIDRDTKERQKPGA